MFIEWAVNCGDVVEGEHGYDLTSAGVTGYMESEEELPYDMNVKLLVCFRAEAGDEIGGTYKWWTQVLGPDGAQTPLPHAVALRADSSPQLIDPERYLLPLTLLVTVTRGGSYRIRLVDEVTQRYEVPLLVAAIPSF